MNVHIDQERSTRGCDAAGAIDEIPMACKDIDAVERTADFDS